MSQQTTFTDVNLWLGELKLPPGPISLVPQFDMLAGSNQFPLPNTQTH